MKTIRRGLQLATAEGAAAHVQVTLVSGFLFTGFALAWGANDFHLGVLGAIPCLGNVFQIWGAYLVDRHPERRRETTALLGFAGRSMWGLMAMLPLIAGAPAAWVMPWILAVYFVYHAFWNASGPGWVAWMAVLVPGKIRGRYLGVRQWILELAIIATAVGAGAIMDGLRGAGMEREGFASFHLLALVAGGVCFLLMRRMPDPGHSAAGVELHPRYLLQPFRDRGFRWLAGLVASWQIGANVASPFLDAHLLKNMNWSFKGVAVLAVLSSLATIAASTWWGRMVDRHGARRILEAGGLGLLLVPLVYAVCPWGWRWPIYGVAVLNGFFMAAFNVALFSFTLARLPQHARAMGSAVLNAAAGLAGFAASLTAGWAAETITDWSGSIGPLLVGNYQLLFVASVFLRLPILLIFRRNAG